MANMIKDYKQVREYSEDYRSGGWITRNVVAYFCSECNAELKHDDKFCCKCGSQIKSTIDRIEQRKIERQKPYNEAIDNLSKIRSEYKNDSLEYKYLSMAIDEIVHDKFYVEG